MVTCIKLHIIYVAVTFLLLCRTSGAAQIVSSVSEADCEKCCTAALQRRRMLRKYSSHTGSWILRIPEYSENISEIGYALHSRVLGGFNLQACKIEGCKGSVIGNTEGNKLECRDITSKGSKRDGCELGRDFRFLGATNLLGGSGFHQCAPGGTVTPISIDTSVPVENPSISISNCHSCCIDLNDNFDYIIPDDFKKSRCEDACNYEGELCFDESNHRYRLGCAIGRDLLAEARVNLREPGNNFQCIGGKISPDGGSPVPSPVATPEPTSEPTPEPTPVVEPTNPPIDTPTFPPENPPTNIPTINSAPVAAPTPAPVGSDGGNEEGDSSFILLAILVGTLFGVSLIICFFVYRMKKRKKNQRMRNLTSSSVSGSLPQFHRTDSSNLLDVRTVLRNNHFDETSTAAAAATKSPRPFRTTLQSDTGSGSNENSSQLSHYSAISDYIFGSADVSHPSNASLDTYDIDEEYSNFAGKYKD